MCEVYAERVLLVEQPDGRDMLKLALEHAGFEVDVANDGESALPIAARRRPAVVIVDINLPRMDGWELGRRLRQQAGPQIRLIALTSRGEPEDQMRSTAAGFHVHLVKPVRPPEVEQMIRVLLAA
jgi:DNA-binding response OmpR family regulator